MCKPSEEKRAECKATGHTFGGKLVLREVYMQMHSRFLRSYREEPRGIFEVVCKRCGDTVEIRQPITNELLQWFQCNMPSPESMFDRMNREHEQKLTRQITNAVRVAMRQQRTKKANQQ